MPDWPCGDLSLVVTAAGEVRLALPDGWSMKLSGSRPGTHPRYSTTRRAVTTPIPRCTRRACGDLAVIKMPNNVWRCSACAVKEGLVEAKEEEVKADPLPPVRTGRMELAERPFLRSEVKKLLDRGWIVARIARELGMSRTTVQRWAQEGIEVSA